jgi:sugar diacid utilization regulator
MGGDAAGAPSRLMQGSDAARDLAARTDADEIADAVSAEIMQEVYGDWAEDGGFVEAMETCTRETVRAIVDMFAGHMEPRQANPSGALAFANLSAELGIPVSMLERKYWVGVAAFWRNWFRRAVAESARTGTPLPELVEKPTELLFAYIDHVLMSVVSRYDSARSEMVRSREHLRRAVLARVLEGKEDGHAAEVEEALGYPLASTHLALVVEGAHRGQLERQLVSWQETAAASATLLLQRGARRWVVWLGRSAPYTARDLQDVCGALAGSGLRVAVGEPWPGTDGLRRSYEEASKAAGVQRALGLAMEAVVSYRDVRLEALLLADEESARRFVAEELGPLAGSNARLERIRETLFASLATGSQVSAAALLGVHENTVRNRIRQAEEMLPGAMTGRRIEVQVALRLERALRQEAARRSAPSDQLNGAGDSTATPIAAPA